MKKPITLKVIGFVPVETFKRKLKSGKVVNKTRVLSPQIMTKKEAAQYHINRVAQQSLKIIGHALNLEKLRQDVLKAKANIRLSKSSKWLKGHFSHTINYFRLICAKIKLFRYISRLNRATKAYLNDFLQVSRDFNFSLYSLKLGLG